MFPPLRLREALSLGRLTVPEVARRTGKKVVEHEIMTRAAAVSFYAMLAFVPFLALVLTLAVQLLPDLSGMTGQKGVGDLSVEELRSNLRTFFPAEAAKVVEDQIVRIQKQPPVGLISFGLAITIWLASSLFLAVIDAMNVIYGVQETRPFWKLRLTAIGMTLIQAAILLTALLAIVAWPFVLGWLRLGWASAVLATVVHWAVIWLMVLLSFAAAFYVGPDADQKWEWITPGSLVGSLAFLLGSGLFGLYVHNFGNYDKTYGSLGGVMVLVFWFWVSSLVLLTAAQMNKVIEDASPLGKYEGQKVDATVPPDLAELRPQPAAGK
jgi:membrane protein